MPEYLAPGVYVEETDTGSKPIEGVSTSTAGMVGVTERGPVGRPMLVTSPGDFERIFGGRLGEEFGEHRHLPFAVEGFFTNGGRRLYVVRALDVIGAVHAAFGLHDRGDAGSVVTALLLAAAEGTGTTVPDAIFVLDGGALAAGDRIRIGDGSAAEYHDVATVEPAADATHVPLHLPLTGAYPAGRDVRHINVVAQGFPSGNPLTLDAAADRGADRIEVTATDANDLSGGGAALAAGDLLRIGADPIGEYRFVAEVDASGTDAEVDLETPLTLRHAAGQEIHRVNPAPAPAETDDTDTLRLDARAGSPMVFVDDRNGNFDVRTDLLAIRDAADGATVEVRRMGELHGLTLGLGVGEPLPAGTTIEGVTMADDGAARALTRNAPAGGRVVTLDNRAGLAEGDVLRIATGDDAEYVTVADVPDPAAAGADPGNVLLEQALRRHHDDGVAVLRQVASVRTDRPASATLFATDPEATELAVTDGGSYVDGDLVRITAPTGERFYAALAADADAVDPRLVTLDAPLEGSHSASAEVAERDVLVTVEALDAGAWGNRLRVSVADEEQGLASGAAVDTLLPPNQFRLASYAGVEPGTVLEFYDPDTGAAVGGPAKVIAVDAVDGTITLQNDLPAPVTALLPGTPLSVRSREFRVTVRLYRRPDPAVPSRNDAVIDEETFRYLSMDPRHSNYIESVIGAIDGPRRSSDGRPEGESRFIRVRDPGRDTPAATTIRLGPETLVDTLPSGRTRPARHPLSGGADSLATLTDDHYIGDDADDPEDRTGLHSLRNVDDVSIVAAPGRVGVAVQAALITHCEQMRYRFAVLDGPPPTDDSLSDVQTHRQQFDTKYAALYHPWPQIREPFPARLGDVPMIPVPPSGHVVGIYARTDIERGVHKAPANEVVRGILDLSRRLNKREHDLLNPSPKNINVIRDFRPDNRGIRVWGSRVITSDPDFKYVPVRRLLIFLEKSIDQGLQWVVFEPNAEPLWARVRQTISNFLTVVWRNGALEGATTEQAFFVKCDRTTMTQTDIDNGRLICLVGVAPVKPAEFVIIRIGLKTAEAES